MDNRKKKCEKCGARTEFDLHCGARVCLKCNHHNGLTRCYCGWSESGGDGRQELIEAGETIEPEDCTNNFEAEFS